MRARSRERLADRLRELDVPTVRPDDQAATQPATTADEAKETEAEAAIRRMVEAAYT